MFGIRNRPSWTIKKCWRLIHRFATDDGAQDLIEYGLLAAFIGVAGWAVLIALPQTIGATYASWIDPADGVPSLWDPPEPGGGTP